MPASRAYSSSEGLRALELPGVNPGDWPRYQEVIPGRFKQKNFCDGNRTPNGRTDGRNIYVDI